MSIIILIIRTFSKSNFYEGHVAKLYLFKRNRRQCAVKRAVIGWIYLHPDTSFHCANEKLYELRPHKFSAPPPLRPINLRKWNFVVIVNRKFCRILKEYCKIPWSTEAWRLVEVSMILQLNVSSHTRRRGNNCAKFMNVF